MGKISKLVFLLILDISLLLCISFMTPVFAGKPVVNNVVVWSSGDHTILNVTVTHVPPSPPIHYVDKIEVNVSGINHIFNIIQNTTTFTYPCDLGIIEGTPSAIVWAHCNVDGYNENPYGPIQVPEFSTSTLLLALTLGTVFAAFAYRKIKFKHS